MPPLAVDTAGAAQRLSEAVRLRTISSAPYLLTLIRKGFRVAIAEQTESPAEARKRMGSKALVGRAIVRVRPGVRRPGRPAA